eukprot:gb/GECH01012310.1/.p1 GENE.gb/GECH01012310.1/~~gb/GECH01012310.1/.p1  ORF type:complete len:523 (+),score=160.43 gb/GECH01012310.1/:1-1569(+)
MSGLSGRVRNPSLLKKVTTPDNLINRFEDGMYLGWSGFTGVGYPKALPVALADHVEENNLEGKLRFNLFVGASAGTEAEDRWAHLNMIDRRTPHQVGKNIQKGINSGRIRFFDKHLSMFPQDLVYGYYTKDKTHGTPGKLDYALIEATAIKEDGSIVPGASVGSTPELIKMADKVIIEVNTRIPSFEGIHDLHHIADPPNRQPININSVTQRVGDSSIAIDPSKIEAIIESDMPDKTTENSPQDDKSKAIAENILEFFEHEVNQGRLPPSLLPVQSGIGSIANAIVGGLAEGPFKGVTVWTEVLQDTFLDFFDQGKLDFASATSIRFSPEGFERFYKGWNDYKDKIILRPQAISNNPELIRRFGVVAMNTPVEFDIYGHANSTLVMGSRMLNGLGGSGDFLRNAKLSIMHAPSVRPTKSDPIGISGIVPMASHIDQTEHDVDIFVTENGLADVRGLCPRDRAKVIIDNCAHPEYRDILNDYYNMALKDCLEKGRAHEPQILSKVFKMYQNLEEKGTMRINSW